MQTPDMTFLHPPSVYDFRQESLMYGPVSDMVPSTPVFEMYPVGFTTMAEYLERHGLQSRIINLAIRMLDDHHFDVESYINKLDSLAFGIDLHWLPHAHGSIEIARLVKRYHPDRPVIFGGFSSSYFFAELIGYPSVDFILRGDSTEGPLLMLIQYLRSGGSIHPSAQSIEGRELESIPNLVWKDSDGISHANPITYLPDTMDDLLMDYSNVLRSVVRYRDLASYKPFRTFMKYPISAALTVRGCTHNCLTCGGSATAFRMINNRSTPAYRSPEKLAQDIRRIGEFSNGPVFVLADPRQAGPDYYHCFFDAISGYKKHIMFELFDGAPKAFFQEMARAIQNFTVEISMESHDEQVRKAFGRPYTNEELERTIDYALEAGVNRFDLFFMIGLKEQTYDSVMGTVEYSRDLLKKYDQVGEHRVIPFISPMAPFLDPGSIIFENPEKHGYRLSARTLEEHRQKLLEPSWKYVLNYETKWMSRDQIVEATYEAGRQLNLMKGEYGVLDQNQVLETDQRITEAMLLMGEIDRIVVSEQNPLERRKQFRLLKERVDNANLGTVCDKRELEASLSGTKINYFKAAQIVIGDWSQEMQRRVTKYMSG